jgi:hypothetical protein
LVVVWAVLAQALLLPLFWQVELYWIKKAGQIFTEEETTTTMVLSNAEWQEARLDEREFVWQGDLYDVKNIDFKGDSVRLSAVCDAWENAFWTKCQQFEHDNGFPLKTRDQRVALTLLLSPFEVPDTPFLFFASKEIVFVLSPYDKPLPLNGRAVETPYLPPWQG